jgi:hypothetical protein
MASKYILTPTDNGKWILTREELRKHLSTFEGQRTEVHALDDVGQALTLIARTEQEHMADSQHG